jgi:hypothetical protein
MPTLRKADHLPCAPKGMANGRQEASPQPDFLSHLRLVVLATHTLDPLDQSHTTIGNHMNLDNFKKSALRAELFLKHKGLDVPHTALLEALARYEGFRSYKAMAGASDTSSTQPAQQKDEAQSCSHPREQRVRVFARTHACDDDAPYGMPDFVLFDFDAVTLNKLQTLCEESTARRMDLDGDLFPYEFIGGDWRISFSECTVSSGEFWASGTEKHSGSKVESPPIRLSALLKVAQRAAELNAPAVLWGICEDAKEDFVEELRAADEDSEGPCEVLRSLVEDGRLGESLASDDILYAQMS